jgi:prolipoprotein diacylglyceryltransferase
VGIKISERIDDFFSKDFVGGFVFAVIIHVLLLFFKTDYIDLLNKWQTLVAGAMALFGALITTFILIRQYSFDKEKHRDEKEKTEFYSVPVSYQARPPRWRYYLHG